MLTTPDDSWTRLAKKMQMTNKITTASSKSASPMGMGTGMSQGEGGVGTMAGGTGKGTAPGGGETKPMKDINLALASTGGKRRLDPFVSFYKLVTPRTPATEFAISDRLASQPKPPPVIIENKDPEQLYGPLPLVPRRVAGILYNGGISAILEVGSFPSSQTYVVRPGDKVDSGTPGMEDMTVESINLTELVLRAVDGRTAKVKISGLRPDQISAIISQAGAGGAGAGAGGPGSGVPGAGGPGRFGSPGGAGGKAGSSPGGLSE